MWLLLSSLTVGWAATIRTVQIDRKDGRYVLESETYLDAPPNAVFRVLTDYDQFAQISSVFEESRFVGSDDDGTPLVYTRVEGCVWLFCKTMERVERLEFNAPDFIATTALPARSDFRYSRSEWQLSPEGDHGTRVQYRLEMEPDFWVPPLLGPMLIKRKLVQGGADAVVRIEGLAQQLQTPPQVHAVD
jgi:hypothetical protein